MNRLLQFLIILLVLGCEREDTKPPFVKFISPPLGITVLERDTILMEVEITDNRNIANVKFYYHYDEVFVTTKPPYIYHLPTAGKRGIMQLMVKATDSAGNVGRTENHHIIVSSNTNPVAAFEIDDREIGQGEEFFVNAQGSYDVEDSLEDLVFRWDWESDGLWDTDYFNTVEQSHIYSEAGAYMVTLEVKDQQGNTNQTKQEIIIKRLFSDPRDGQEYEYVTLGDQTWMAENLNYLVQNSWCYNKNVDSCKTNGRLYSFGAAISSCPIGWHLPNDEEWMVLEKFLGMNESDLYLMYKIRQSGEVGYKLKTEYGWLNEGNGSNIVGFAALPAGLVRYNNQSSGGVWNERIDYWWGVATSFWVSESKVDGGGFTSGMYRSLFSSKTGIGKGWDASVFGNSVRCIKN